MDSDIYYSEITKKFIQRNVIGNPNVTQDFIDKYLNKSWHWKFLSESIFITQEFIEKYIDKPWDWSALSRNQFITLNFISRHIDKPWEWGRGGLSSNSSVTPEFVIKYKDKLEITENIIEILRENSSAIKIQRKMKEWLYKPECKDGTHGLMVKKDLRELNIV